MKHSIKKNGFTLIEMLAVIVLLVLIFMISFPAITKMIKGTNSNIDKATLDMIKDSAKDFMNEKTSAYYPNQGNTYCVSMDDLINNGNLNSKSLNNLKKEEVQVEVTFDNDNKLNYEIVSTCTEIINEYTLYLNGDKNIEINVGAGGQYTESGIVAKNRNNEDVSSTLVKTILNSKDEVLEYVDTTKIDVYTVKYTVLIDGKNYSIERYVNVVDKIAPVITLTEASDTVYYLVNEYDLLSGVSVTDNTNEVITPTISSNLSLGFKGVFNITYSATDASGNTSSISKMVTIVDYYQDGTAVYFNPVSGAKCTAGEAVSITGTKTGCMKWYAFNDGGSSSDTINLILDHNTTASVAWKSTGSNVSGPTNVMTQLQTDTSSWAGVPTRTDSYSVSNGTATYTINYSTYKARLIKASEIAIITGNSSFVEATTPYTSWFYLDSNNQTQTATTTGASNYDWLFDYTNGCTSYGCNIDDASNYGYWTSTAVSGRTSYAWSVNRNGLLYYRIVGSGLYGVRPVITILKSNL